MDRKYLVYGIAGLALILLIVLLGSCVLNRNKAAEATPTAEAAAAEQPVQTLYDQWEYLTVIATCSSDVATRDIVCYIPVDNDNTTVTNFMIAKGQQGWELSGILSTGGDPNTAFVFKRLLRTP